MKTSTFLCLFVAILIFTCLTSCEKEKHEEEEPYAIIKIVYRHPKFKNIGIPQSYQIKIKSNSDVIQKHGEQLEEFDTDCGIWFPVSFFENKLDSQKIFVKSLTVKKLEDYYKNEEAKEKAYKQNLEKRKKPVFQKTIH